MESPSGRRRRLGAQPPSGAGRNCRPRPCQSGDGGGVDRISGLNDDLLIQVLVRLRCAGVAVRTGVLSRRWRGLWRYLPEHCFRGIAYDTVKAAVAQIALPKLFLLDINIPSWLPAEAVASLLRTAARLDPVELSISIIWVKPMTMEAPSFARARSIRLNVNELHLTPPAQGSEFPVLERLSIINCRFDAGALISRCPRLRVLELICSHVLDTITVHSATVEELLVTGERRLRGVDIVAPLLKKFTLRGAVSVDFSMSLLAPTVENLSWNCRIAYSWLDPHKAVGIDASGTSWWSLIHLKLGREERGFLLGLGIRRLSQHPVTHVRSLQEMFQFLDISVLELCLKTRGHAYGAVVLKLLRICSAIQRLKLVSQLNKRINEACPPSCPCDQQSNWRSQNISLTGLEEVEIENFKGRGHEVDFLKLLFRCASLTKVTVKLASNVVAWSRECKEAYNVFKANPAVECHVYRKYGKEVIYA
ncbi:putative FBD-associated F-box protein [Panicum miliaceum]|uniref:FBD-associated F-box protein n=1 Tax=Panicum miliaceum TaxID=4540 RepID=A0A3L6TGN9_PANMI|nr:putative FBD-associated F-box protein [Panicum miliaceum]